MNKNLDNHIFLQTNGNYLDLTLCFCLSDFLDNINQSPDEDLSICHSGLCCEEPGAAACCIAVTPVLQSDTSVVLCKSLSKWN